MMDVDRAELCYPQLHNLSCRGVKRPGSEAGPLHAALLCLRGHRGSEPAGDHLHLLIQSTADPHQHARALSDCRRPVGGAAGGNSEVHRALLAAGGFVV